MAWLIKSNGFSKRPTTIDPVSESMITAVASSSSFMSMMSLSEVHGKSEWKTKFTLVRFSALHLFLLWRQGLQMARRLRAKVVEAGGEIICFSEFASYDETPLPVRVLAEENVVVNVGANGAAIVEPGAQSIDSADGVSHFDVKAGSIYQGVSLEFPCPLQVMDRATGETCAHCLGWQGRKGLGDISARLMRRDRHVISDSDGAVLRGERRLATKRPGVGVAQGFCRLHRISAIASNGMDKFMKDDVSGITNVALSLKASGAMRIFRRALRAVIRARLVVLRGSPGCVADRRRAKLLDVFCPIHPGNHSAFIDGAVVQLCANGN
ncbi:unnamed protein product [Prorocentrum cordatum]|uniref:Uncharacterized protein n=1 Tax=Prorocentrum cordatum TaxID=2364126 RepID=A0ABN9WR89_9DINO|nr:unnamed protein product [Polarella glacialis]